MTTTAHPEALRLEAIRKTFGAFAALHAIDLSIASGELGKPLVILQRRSSNYRADSRPGWFFDPVMAGGGIAMNVGPHGLDKIQWLSGGPVVEVIGKTWNRGGLDVETDVVATARLASGATARKLMRASARS